MLSQILHDIQVEILDEASQNFRRQAFFTDKWRRRVGPLRPGGATLIDTGRLRRSISSEIRQSSIVFTYTEPYAPTHNAGAEIHVTARMKRFFWAKYYKARGTFARRKDGTPSRSRKNVSLTSEAQFWKYLALKKVGSVIHIPRRQFLGTHPQLEAAVRQIIQDNLAEYFAQYDITTDPSTPVPP